MGVLEHINGQFAYGRPTRRGLFFCVLWASALFSAYGTPQTGPGGQRESVPKEYEVKAAFLYNFARFATWPDDAFEDEDSLFTIGVLGDDPFGNTLERVLEEETVGGRSIEFERSRDPQELTDCHLVFVSASERDEIEEIMRVFAAHPILTVCDSRSLAKPGMIVRLFREETKVRFEIDPGAAERCGLKLRAQLLQLARVVDRGPPEES